MSNVLIVESENDKYFIEALINYINLNIEIGEPICRIDEYDCLNAWQECLPTDKKLKQKDFDKFWIQIYQRYDCCTKKESKRAGEKCNNEASLKKDIYDFDNKILNELNFFLQELGEK